MFVDITKKLLGSLCVHVIESFNFVWISFFNTTFAHMIGKMKFVNIHPCSRSHFLRHFILECSFFILSIGAQVAVVIIKDDLDTVHVRQVSQKLDHDSVDLKDL